MAGETPSSGGKVEISLSDAIKNPALKEQIGKADKEKFLFRIIRQAFNKRRKTLRNSLKETVSVARLGIFFAKYNINPSIRPEDLTLSDFKNLASL